jgi:hypothetical protein
MGSPGGRDIGFALSLLAGGLVTWSTTGSFGSALSALCSLFGAIGALSIALVYNFYFGVLGASEKRRGTPERRAYKLFRRRLSDDNSPAQIYTRWLEIALRWVERFFHDAGMADGTLFPHAFGLRRAAPLWTAPAFDRCLLIAAIYPVGTIFIFWIVSGHADSIGVAFGLEPDASVLRRIAVATCLISEFAALIFAARALNRPGTKRKVIALAVTMHHLIGHLLV